MDLEQIYNEYNNSEMSFDEFVGKLEFEGIDNDELLDAIEEYRELLSENARWSGRLDADGIETKIINIIESIL